MKHSLTDDDKQLVAIFNRRGPNVMVMLLFVASGIILACGEPAGLYLLLPASLVAHDQRRPERLVLPAPAKLSGSFAAALRRQAAGTSAAT